MITFVLLLFLITPQTYRNILVLPNYFGINFNENMDDMINTVVNMLKLSTLTHYKISADTGITAETISNYRRDKTKPAGVNLKVLSEYFGISTESNKHHGKNLSEYLANHGITIPEFSSMIGLSNSDTSNLLSQEKIDDGELSKIANTLHIPIMYIEEGEKAMQAKNRLLSKEQEIKDRTRNIEFVLKTNSELAEQVKMQQKTIDTLSSVISNQAESLKEKDKQTSEVIELLKEQLKKGQDAGMTFRAANLVVEEDE